MNTDPRIGQAYQQWKQRTTCTVADATTRQLQMLWDAFSAGYHAGHASGCDDACDAGPDAEDRWEADVDV